MLMVREKEVQETPNCKRINRQHVESLFRFYVENRSHHWNDVEDFF